MPVMNLYDAEPQEAITTLYLLAYLFYPQQEKQREVFIAHKAAEISLAIAKEENDDPWLPLGLFELVLSTRGHEVPTPKSADRSSGAYSGRVMLFLVEMILAGEPRASIGTAMAMAEAYFESTSVKDSDGAKLRPVSHAARLKQWSRCKPVAHIWASIALMVEMHGHEDAVAVFERDPLLYFAYAEAILNVASRLANKHSREAGVTLEEFWTAPPTLRLPPVQIANSGLEDWQLEILDNYKAEKSKPRNRY